MTDMRYGMPWYQGSHPSHPGAMPFPGGPRHGFCHACGHPASQCQCWRRDCRKEPKELLADPSQSQADRTKSLSSLDVGGSLPIGDIFVRSVLSMSLDQAAAGALKAELATAMSDTGAETPARNLALVHAFIGGGCCVHLSIEYSPLPFVPGGMANRLAVAAVVAPDGTALAWGKWIGEGEGYRVQENILTTKPGANVWLAVVNATARLRWCEIFSC